MKIVYVTPKYFPEIGGVETYVKILAENLVHKGFEIEVICTDPKRKYPTREIINNVVVTRFPAFAPNDAYYISPQLLKYLYNVKCDIIHAHNYHAIPSFFSLLAKKDKKFIFTPHTFGMPTNIIRKLAHKIYKPFGKRLFQNADQIITVARIEKRYILQEFNINEEKLCYVPLPIEIDNQVILRKENKFEPDVKIAFVGRLSYEKNVDVLISAFKLAKKEYNNIKLYIVGEGPLKKMLEEIAKDTKDIQFLGAIKHADVQRFLKKIDILVLPSKFEVFGIIVLEAMVNEVPVIVTPVGELKYLKNYKHCLFTKIGDVEDLAEKLKILASDHKLARKLGRNGRKYVEKNHNIKDVIRYYISIYNEVVR